MPIEQMNFGKYYDMYKAASALDQLQGPEALAAHMRYLGGYSDDKLSKELGVPVQDALTLARKGLMKAKDIFKQ